MKITAISDLHGYYPNLSGGDLLIVAGDLTATDSAKENCQFVEWLRSQPYEMKVFIGGNHDNVLEKYGIVGTNGDSCFYLCDSGTEFKGLKIWGSPWTKTFEGMNPKCKAFTCDTEEELYEKWKLIPKGTHILVTHSPSSGVLDEVGEGKHEGSESLIKPMILSGCKLHIFGHIHEAYGSFYNSINGISYFNVSHVNQKYEPVNKPMRIEL